MELAGGTVGALTAATPLQLMGIVDRPDNEVGNDWAKLLVRINLHTYNSDTGAAGV
jgi:hypothetical protein